MSHWFWQCYCCEPKNCDLFTETFDGSGDDPGSQWDEVSGDYDRVSGELHTISVGLLASTVCHPGWATLGSYIITFDLTNLADGNVYHFRCGHPTDSDYEVKYVLAAAGNDNWDITCTIYGDGAETETFTFYTLYDAGETIGAKICFMPGSMISATCDAAWLGSSAVELCIGTSNTGACHAVNGSTYGNFHIIDGYVDNLDAIISWVDDPICPECGCICYADGDNWACFPKQMTATFVSRGHVDCPAIDGKTVTLYQTYSDVPVSFKYEWKSDDFDVAGTNLFIKIQCYEEFDTKANWLRGAIFDSSTGLETAYPLGFYAGGFADWRVGDLDTLDCNPIYVKFEGVTAAGGTCDPPPDGQVFFACGTTCYGYTEWLLWDLVITV